MTSLLALLARRLSRTPAFWLAFAMPAIVLAAVWIGLRHKGGIATFTEEMTFGMSLLLCALAYGLGYWPLSEERRQDRLTVLLAGPSFWRIGVSMLVASQAGALLAVVGVALVMAAVIFVGGNMYSETAVLRPALGMASGCLLSSCIGLLAAIGPPRWELATAGFVIALVAAGAILQTASAMVGVVAALAGVSVWLAAWGWLRRRITA